MDANRFAQFLNQTSCAALLVFSLTGPTFAAESITNEALIDGRSQLQGARDHVDLIRIMLKLACSQKESQ